MRKLIYLDNAATTKPKQEVIKEIEYVLENEWGNPSSLYELGRNAKQIVDKSRKTIADFIGAKQSEIVFTSGACESNSMALLGLMNKKYSLITSVIEHKSIMNLAKDYDNSTYISVNKDGYINIEELELACQNKIQDKLRFIVSIQFANNEIGTIQDMKLIADIVHKYNGILHTDATQMIPNTSINIKELGIDMMSFSGQKLGATKGIGILYIKDSINLNPIIYGSQEKSRRGGTENTPYIAGLTKAIEIIHYSSSEIRDYFWQTLSNKLSDIYVIGSMSHRLNNNLSICFKGIEAESLLLMLDNKGIYVSSGSACNSASLYPSYVLSAIGMVRPDINGVIRFSFGEDITKIQCNKVVEEIVSSVKILRKMNR